MFQAVAGILLAVTLPLPFGRAEAAALVVSEDGSAVLEVTVEVSGSPAAVLVRGVGPVDELPPVALAPQGDGTYAGIVELNTTVGVLLGFEYLPSGGGPSTVSDLFTLVQLGVDPAALAPRPVTTTSPASTSTTSPPPQAEPDDGRWGWLAVAAGSACLALVLVWFLLGRGRLAGDGAAAPGVSRLDVSSGNPDNTRYADRSTPDPAGEP